MKIEGKVDTSSAPVAICLIVAGALSGLTLHLAAGTPFWFPGVLFGLGFAVANRFNAHLAISFATVSGVIYFLAFQAGGITAGVIEGQWAGYLFGPVSGTVGAVLLLQAVALFLGLRVPIFNTAPVIAGALLGLGLMQSVATVSWNEPLATQIVVYAFWFALWQGVVGVLCYRAAKARFEGGDSSAFSDRLRTFLSGPVVQLVGLLASLAALAQILFKGEP